MKYRYTKEEMFVKNSKASNSAVRNRIVRDKLLEYACALCGNNGKWNGEDLTLALDHIDGDNKNHLLSNLRFLCPNCHSQTTTFAGRNNKTMRPHKVFPKYYCSVCGVEISRRTHTKKCTKCYNLSQRRQSRPAADILLNLVKQKGWTEVGKMYGVTDNTIRSWLHDYGLSVKFRNKVF